VKRRRSSEETRGPRTREGARAVDETAARTDDDTGREHERRERPEVEPRARHRVLQR
jgi:hypothetical protein